MFVFYGEKRVNVCRVWNSSLCCYVVCWFEEVDYGWSFLRVNCWNGK